MKSPLIISILTVRARKVIKIIKLWVAQTQTLKMILMQLFRSQSKDQPVPDNQQVHVPFVCQQARHDVADGSARHITAQ